MYRFTVFHETDQFEHVRVDEFYEDSQSWVNCGIIIILKGGAEILNLSMNLVKIMLEEKDSCKKTVRINK